MFRVMPESHAARGQRRALRLLVDLGAELRAARVAAGLTLRSVAAAVGVSLAEISRIERGVAHWADVVVLSRIAAVVGLELSLRAFPGPDPLRDGRHAGLFASFRAVLGRGLRLRAEVPVQPGRGLRAWDATVDDGVRVGGAELETRLTDSQALIRRITLKQRDGGVDVVILVLADTRANRRAFRAAEEQLQTAFPLSDAAVRTALAAGRVPEANGVLFLPVREASAARRRRDSRPTQAGDVAEGRRR